jgi:hypothetical protein
MRAINGGDKMLKAFVGGLLALGILAGCDVNPDIAAVGNNEYMLTETDMKVGVGGVRPAIIASVHARADLFCTQQGSKAKKVDNRIETAGIGRFATYSLTFKCS